MFVRLASLAPDLVEALGAASPAQLRAVSAGIAGWAVDSTGLDGPTVEGAREAARAGRVGAAAPVRAALGLLVETLDEQAWDVQDRPDDYLPAFSRARAAAALRSALDDDPLRSATEAAYEAYAATGDLPALRRRVHALLAH